MKKSSHASLIPFWEMKSLCSCASLKFVWACQKAMAIYETTPKVIDIQGGSNNNFLKHHCENKTWFLVIVLKHDDSNMWVMLVSNYA